MNDKVPYGGIQQIRKELEDDMEIDSEESTSD